MEDELRGFFLQFKETACHFLWQVFLCVCVWLKWLIERKHTNAGNTQNRKYACTHEHALAHVCTLLHGDSWSRVMASRPWGFGLVWVGLLILTAWPCLASCQCWASSRWLLWPPINQGQLPRWCTAASPPVAALPCRVQGGREKGREATALLSFQLLL